MAILKLRDGAQLTYEDTGEGHPIVFLHGWGMRGTYFAEQVSALSPRYRTIVPDLRGHGASSPLRETQGLTTLVDDVLELLNTLDLSDTMLVGWSMGAMVGWAVMQRQEAASISSLVTIDMVPRLLNDENWRFGLREGEDVGTFAEVIERMLEDWPAFTRIFVPRIFAPGKTTERCSLAEKIIGETENNDPASMARLWLSMANQDFRAQLAEIEVPSLVAYGALSQLYSEEASEWVVEHMPNARGVRFAESGHAPHLEQPDLFNKEIETLAEQAWRRTTGPEMTYSDST